ncbi:MAG: CHAT domain-containing protein, partial [Rudanella sp.]|nr:CHAT domain-containing protein [Rudanella sp.]
MDTLLFSFANNQDRPLPMLWEEDQGISWLLTPRSSKQQIQVLRDSYATTKTVANNIWYHRETLALFHFSGHAGKTVLQLEDKVAEGKGITVLQLEDKVAEGKGIADLLGLCKNLQLVFLNGCSTRQHIELLRAAGVRAMVIATSTPVNDTVAKDFALRFYETLVQQVSLQQAIETVQGTFSVEEADILIEDLRGGNLDTSRAISRNQWYFECLDTK